MLVAGIGLSSGFIGPLSNGILCGDGMVFIWPLLLEYVFVRGFV